jgi:hypothetical protein
LTAPASMNSLTPDKYDRLAVRLQDLRYEIGASSVLLADTAGRVLTEIGAIDGLDPAELAAYLRSSFDAPQIMAQDWHEARAFNLIYHEGMRFDLYATNINAQLFVVLVFDRRLGPNRLGVVWLYLKRALVDLQKVLA